MDIMKLKASLGLDSSEYIAGLSNAEDMAKKSTIGSALKTVGKAAIAGVTAAATAISGLTTKAVSEYANYEQLVGGVTTLFGDSAAIVLDNASNAFSTAGMSMNKYMETAIQASASLINSLGGDQARAAELMDMSIQDMSDNVNKMGTTMEAVQNAYRGFSRGNFTMLDNLALGFAGTKEGMQELLDKANEINASQGVFTEYSIESYADIVEAIHVVQDEMGIVGTTVDEAAGTISGSMNSLKSAWDNLIVGFARGDADMGRLITNVVDGAVTMVQNIIPIAEQAIVGIGEFITEVAPIITEKIPEVLGSVLPGILDAAVSIVNAILETITKNLTSVVKAGVELVKSLVQGIMDNLDMILEAVFEVINVIFDNLSGENLVRIAEVGLEIVQKIAESFIANLPVIIQSVVEIITSIVSYMAGEGLANIVGAAIQLISSLASSFMANTEVVLGAIQEILASIIGFLTGDGLANMLNAGLELIKSLASGFMNNMSTVLQSIMDIINAVLDFLMGDGMADMLEMGLELIFSLATGLIENLPTIVKTILDIVTSLIQSIASRLPEFVTKGVELIVSLITGLMEALPDIIQAIIDVLTTLVEYIIDNLPMFLEAGLQIIVSLAQALIDNAPEVLEAMLTLVESLITLIIDNLGEFVAQGLEILISIGKGIAEAVPELLEKAGEAIEGLWDAFVNTDWGEVGGNIIDGIKDGIGGAVGRLWDAAVNAAKTALEKIKNVLGIASPSKVFRDQVGKMIPEGMAIGISANTDAVEDAMEDLSDLTTSPFSSSSNVTYFPSGHTGGIAGGITLNVYPSEGMDVEEFADYTIDKLNQELEREGRALA